MKFEVGQVLTVLERQIGMTISESGERRDGFRSRWQQVFSELWKWLDDEQSLADYRCGSVTG